MMGTIAEARNSLIIVRVVVVIIIITLTDAHVGHEHKAGEGQGQHSGSKFIISADHIGEHLRGHVSSFVYKMTEGELEFFYFELHDTDNNTKLDGLEILKALYHALPVDEADAQVHGGKGGKHGKTEEEAEEEARERKLKYYTDIIDQLLRQDDVDSDGYLAYPEYITAIQREVSRGGVKISRGQSPEEASDQQQQS